MTQTAHAITADDPDVQAFAAQLRGIRLPPPATRRAIRRAAGRTMQDIADLIGVDIMSVSRWERGLVRPKRDHLVRYAKALAALEVLAAERATDSQK